MHRNSPSRMMGDWISALALLLGVLIGSWLMSRDAHAASFSRWENRRELAGGFRLIPEIGILSSSKNFNEKGTQIPADGITQNSLLQKYSKTLIDFNGIYGFTSNLTGFARLSMTSISYTTESLQGSASGLTEQALGFNYRVYESASGRGADQSAVRRTSVDLQFQADIPMYDNVSARTNRTPLLGDGSLDLTFGPFLTMPLNQGSGSRIYLVAGLAYAIRGNGFSSALPYQLGLTALPEQNGFLWKLGLNGMKSMGSDPATGTQLAVNSNTLDAGNSFIVDAINSSYMALKATLGYQTMSGTQYFASYATTLSGTSTAALTGIYGGIQWRWGGGKSSATSTEKNGIRTKSGFISYNLDGHVLVSNDRLNLIKIDKGEQDGVAQGQVFDVFRTRADGTAEARIARGVVTKVGASQAIVNIRQYAKEVWIQPGFIVRRVVK